MPKLVSNTKAENQSTNYHAYRLRYSEVVLQYVQFKLRVDLNIISLETLQYTSPLG